MAEDLNVELNLGAVTAHDLEGEALVPPGRYHVLIRNIARRNDPSPHLRFRYEVLAGTDPSAVGALSSERFFLSEKAEKRLAILGHRLGLIGDNDFGGRKSVDWSRAIGRDLVCQVVHDTFERQDGAKGVRSQWGFATFWRPDDDRARDVPKGAVPGGPRVPPPAGAAAASPADDYSDI